MSFWLLLKLIFLFLYLFLSAIITFIIYKEETPYYTPLFVKKKSAKDSEKEETINIHDEFDVFTKRDKPINIVRLFIGVLTIFWIKFILALIFAEVLAYKIFKRRKEKNLLEKKDIDYILKTTNFLTKIFLLISGLLVDFKRLPDEKVLPIYRKYFGPDYKIDYNGKFGCYISNHSCLYDMAIAMAYLGCGFVSKIGVKSVPIVGKLNIGLDTIFVDRSSTGVKKDVLEDISQRQKELMEGKPSMPFLIFPEGTTTSGRHLLKFKKGAFNSLLPIKPTFIHPNLNRDYHLGAGASNVGINYFLSLTKLYNKVEYIELPIMNPNEYMYTNFSSYGKEKWEIYAEVAREIMCTLGNFEKSEMGLKDSFRFISCIEEKTLLDRDTYKIKSE